MKKTIIILTLFILSLLNGFAKVDNFTKRIITNAVPLALIANLGKAYDQCPKTVNAIIKEKKLKITQDDLSKCKSIYANIKEQEKTIKKYRDDPNRNGQEIIAELIQATNQVCKKNNVNTSSLAVVTDRVCTGSDQDKAEIECALRAYSPQLLAEAEDSYNYLQTILTLASMFGDL